MEIKGAAVVNTLPPYGHVIAAEKWRNSTLLQGLKGERSTIFFSILGYKLYFIRFLLVQLLHSRNKWILSNDVLTLLEDSRT